MVTLLKENFLNLLLILVTPVLAEALNVDEKLSLEGTLTGVYQYVDVHMSGTDDTDRGAAVFDLTVNFHPAQSNEFQVILGFASGNALNSVVPFSLTPYADDLEDDLTNINSRDRHHLLEAWYKHTFTFSENIFLGITGGIIDATVYIDDNNFAKDELSQFMNSIFVNSTVANLHSHDIGGIVELKMHEFTFRALVMNTKNHHGENFNYYALQAGYTLATSLGEGNYRLYGFATDNKFKNWNETDRKKLQGFGISLDQKLSAIFGVFVRAGWQDDAALIDHDTLYSGGINVNGNLWDRGCDEIGIAYAYMDGAGKAEIEKTHAFEAYARFQISVFSNITFDVQYINDNMKTGEDKAGFVYGVRVNAYF